MSESYYSKKQLFGNINKQHHLNRMHIGGSRFLLLLFVIAQPGAITNSSNEVISLMLHRL